MIARVKMLLERETKGTFRYREESRVPIIGVLYIKKYAFENGAPHKIFVELHTSDGSAE